MFQFVEKFITDFSWRRLTIFIGILILLASSIMLYEWQTATNELSRYERSVVLLQELDNLIDSKHPEITEVSKTIISRLKTVVENDNFISTLNVSVSPEVSQAFFSASPWLLFFLIMLPSVLKGKDKDAGNILLGFGLFAIIAAVLAYFIPINLNNWIRFGVPQFFNTSLIIYFTIKGDED